MPDSSNTASFPLLEQQPGAAVLQKLTNLVRVAGPVINKQLGLGGQVGGSPGGFPGGISSGGPMPNLGNAPPQPAKQATIPTAAAGLGTTAQIPNLPPTQAPNLPVPGTGTSPVGGGVPTQYIPTVPTHPGQGGPYEFNTRAGARGAATTNMITGVSQAIDAMQKQKFQKDAQHAEYIMRELDEARAANDTKRYNWLLEQPGTQKVLKKIEGFVPFEMEPDPPEISAYKSILAEKKQQDDAKAAAATQGGAQAQPGAQQPPQPPRVGIGPNQQQIPGGGGGAGLADVSQQIGQPQAGASAPIPTSTPGAPGAQPPNLSAPGVAASQAPSSQAQPGQPPTQQTPQAPSLDSMGRPRMPVQTTAAQTVAHKSAEVTLAQQQALLDAFRANPKLAVEMAQKSDPATAAYIKGLFTSQDVQAKITSTESEGEKKRTLQDKLVGEAIQEKKYEADTKAATAKTVSEARGARHLQDQVERNKHWLQQGLRQDARADLTTRKDILALKPVQAAQTADIRLQTMEESRQAVMDSQRDDPKHPNQQAAVLLLANHIQFAMGQLEGTVPRINKDFMEKAYKSGKLDERIRAMFVEGKPSWDASNFLTGINLTQSQMDYMISSGITAYKSAWTAAKSATTYLAPKEEQLQPLYTDEQLRELQQTINDSIAKTEGVTPNIGGAPRATPIGASPAPAAKPGAVAPEKKTTVDEDYQEYLKKGGAVK